MIVIIEKNTDKLSDKFSDKFLTSPIKNAAIRQPTMLEDIKIAEKVPLKSP